MKLYLCCIKLRSRTYLFYFAISMFTLCVLWFLFFIMYVLHLIVHDCISFPRQSFAIVLYHVNNLWSILWCRFQTVCYIHGDIKKYPTLFFNNEEIYHAVYDIPKFFIKSLSKSILLYISYITLRRLGNQLISHKVFLKFLEMISLAIDYYLVKQKSIYFTI